MKYFYVGTVICWLFLNWIASPVSCYSETWQPQKLWTTCQPWLVAKDVCDVPDLGTEQIRPRPWRREGGQQSLHSRRASGDGHHLRVWTLHPDHPLEQAAGSAVPQVGDGRSPPRHPQNRLSLPKPYRIVTINLPGDLHSLFDEVKDLSTHAHSSLLQTRHSADKNGPESIVWHRCTAGAASPRSLEFGPSRTWGNTSFY